MELLPFMIPGLFALSCIAYEKCDAYKKLLDKLANKYF